MASNYDKILGDTLKESEEEAKVEFNERAFEAYSRIKQRTPVDTGRARNNWGINDIEPDDVKDRPVVDIDPERGIEDSVYIYNNLDYVSNLEMGSSTQAPSGFIRLTLAELGLTYTGNVEER